MIFNIFRIYRLSYTKLFVRKFPQNSRKLKLASLCRRTLTLYCKQIRPIFPLYFLGISVYNVVVLCLVGVPIALMMKEQLDASYVLISLFIFFATAVTICLVFIPKVKLYCSHHLSCVHS